MSLNKPKKLSKKPLNQSKPKKASKILLEIFFVIFSVFLIFFSGLLIISIYKNLVQLEKISAQRQNLTNQINFWNSVLQKYPGYKDAYFRLALLEYQLKDFQKTKEYLNQALLLDPNYSDALKLQEVLNKNYSAGFSSGF